MKPEENDFRLDPKARSFRVSDFGWRDLPLLVGAFVLMTLAGLIAGWLPLHSPPESWRWVASACLLLIAAIITGHSWFQKRAGKFRQDLSPELRSLAADPANHAAAIRMFQIEHPGASLSFAKRRIEEFSRTGQ